MAAGLLLLLMAGWRVNAAAAAQRAVRAEVAGWPEERAWPAVPGAPQELDHREADASPEEAAGAPAPPAYAQGDPVFRLEIERIAVRNIVVYGSSEAALGQGPGLVERTALPGFPGNTVVAAHRDYYFWRLGELAPGDEIRLSSPDGTWTYRVTAKWVVGEADTTILAPTAEPSLTLFTCWPLFYAGRAPDRLVVRAVRSDIIEKNHKSE